LRLRQFQSLLNQRQLLDAAIANLGDGILLVQADWTIVSCNRRAQHLLGLAEETGGGTDLRRHLAPWRASVNIETLDRRRPQHFDLRREGAPLLIVEVRANPVVDRDDQLLYQALTLRDVTAERHEDRLRHDFFTLTAHKMRTPLTVLRGLVELVLDPQGRQMGADLVIEMAPDLLRKIGDLSDLVDDLLRRTSVDDFRVRDTEVHTTVRPAAEAAAAAVRGQGARAFELALDGAETAARVAHGDLELILRELIENAVKFNANTVPRVQLRAAAGECSGPLPVTIWLSDNGVGIPSEHFDNVFRDCFQVDEHGTGNVPGMGLGLGLVRRVVEAYGGSVAVANSTPGLGTTFRLCLP
jgi:signal transduction histidine kinase